MKHLYTLYTLKLLYIKLKFRPTSIFLTDLIIIIIIIILHV